METVATTTTNTNNINNTDWLEVKLREGYHQPRTRSHTPKQNTVIKHLRGARGRLWSLTTTNEISERWFLLGDGPQPPPTPHPQNTLHELNRARRELDDIHEQLRVKKREVENLERMVKHPLFDTIPTKISENDIFF
jgi:hypothetical protein